MKTITLFKTKRIGKYSEENILFNGKLATRYIIEIEEVTGKINTGYTLTKLENEWVDQVGDEDTIEEVKKAIKSK